MNAKFDVRITGEILKDPEAWITTGLMGAGKGWASEIKKYPPQAPFVNYKRTKALGNKGNLWTESLVPGKSVGLPSTSYAKRVLFGPFNGGYVVWQGKAEDLITATTNGFTRMIKQKRTQVSDVG